AVEDAPAGAGDDPALERCVGTAVTGLVDVEVGDAADAAQPAAEDADEIADDDDMVVAGAGAAHECQARRYGGEAAGGDVLRDGAAADPRALAGQSRPRTDDGADTFIVAAGAEGGVGLGPQFGRQAADDFGADRILTDAVGDEEQAPGLGQSGAAESVPYKGFVGRLGVGVGLLPVDVPVAEL